MILVIAILQWVQRNLLGMGSLVDGSFSHSAMYLQNRCQRRSGMLEIWMPFGQYAVHTNLAKVDSS